ncbi:SMEK domain-containing protein [Oceanospirillum beijerinckii]|uniref:SMEK domain-containing protein n=1 Tax=Oceanospirillum beijerinckii TaxID=64976 RepID=UPI00040630A6|nr:SMEK domain-containing protein [Oceanospirillum beijerinckii]
MKRKYYLDQILKLLAQLSKEVEIKSSINLTDLNIYSENFYRDLFNLSFGWNLKNINLTHHNAAAIDLADDENRIAIQVTSTSSLNKVRSTVEKFIKSELYEKYDRLIIINISKKQIYRTLEIGDPSKHILNTKKDILDYRDIAKSINDRDTSELSDIYDFLSNEINVVEVCNSISSDDPYKENIIRHRNEVSKYFENINYFKYYTSEEDNSIIFKGYACAEIILSDTVSCISFNNPTRSRTLVSNHLYSDRVYIDFLQYLDDFVRLCDHDESIERFTFEYSSDDFLYTFRETNKAIYPASYQIKEDGIYSDEDELIAPSMEKVLNSLVNKLKNLKNKYK